MSRSGEGVEVPVDTRRAQPERRWLAGKTKRTGAIRVGLFAVVASLVFATVEASRANEPPPAPSFVVESLTGETLNLETLLQKGPVLLDFWATWCKPCVLSLPGIEELHQKYEDRGFTVVGISIDGPRNYAKVRPFAARLGLSYPLVLDRDGRLQRDYRVTAVPTAVLVDTTGAAVHTQRGYRPGEHEALGEKVEALLRPRSGSADQP